MKVLLGEDKMDYEAEIKVGDIFYDEQDDVVFMLHFLDYDEAPYATVSLNGNGRWETYMKFNEATRELRKDVSNGLLKHFKQEEWQLELKRK